MIWGSNKVCDICIMFEKVKGDNMNCSFKKNVNVFGIYWYFEVFLCEYYWKRLWKVKEFEFWLDIVRNLIVRNDFFNG